VNLSLQDALALLYTGSGSQRAVARSLGISHQKVGRILRIGQDGGFKSNARVLADPDLIAIVNRALSTHSIAAAAVARSQGLPFDTRYPVLMQRMPFKEPHRVGVLGDRVEALHTHWLSNALRDAWMRAIRNSGKYDNVSVGSIVNMLVYTKNTDKQLKGTRRDESQKSGRKSIQRQIKANVAQGLIQTPYISIVKGNTPFHDQLENLKDKLDEKHAPATGEDMPGTLLATRYLFQIDTRQGKDDKFRKTHPIPGNGKAGHAKPRKARGSGTSAGKPRTRK
jgi:hypothetical protein